MSRTSRLLLIALICTTALIMAGLGSYAVWSRSHQGVILGSVTISGLSLDGLERSEAEATLSELESQQGGAVIEIVVNGEPPP